MTVRLFNPNTKLWSIYWADSNLGQLDPPVLGSFENKVGHFVTKDIFKDKSILVIFRWETSDVAKFNDYVLYNTHSGEPEEETQVAS